MAARLGGSARDHAFGPALGADGFLYAGGTTLSSDLPTSAGAHQPRHGGGGSDAMLFAVDPEGALAYASYWGGSGEDAGRFVAADAPRRRVALVGETTSSDLEVRGAAQSAPGGLYVAVFEAAPIRVDEPADSPPAETPAPQ
jgi:hypothetical protein